MKLDRPKLLLLFITLIFLIITSRAYQNQALAFHFVDEEDNLVLGKYLLEGEKLYSDLFSHHQPMSYIFSAGVQKITHPNTIYLLIKRHREAVIAWSCLWILGLVWRFGLPLLMTVVILEPIKIFLLGHLFLSESLVIYPFAYLLSWIFLPPKKIFQWEIFFIGFCFSLSFLLLSPLWPVLLVMFVCVILKIKSSGNYLLFLVLGLTAPVILTLRFVSVFDYLFNAFYINFKYYIPMTTSHPWLTTILQAFASPILTFTNIQNNNATLQLARILSVLLIFNIFLLIKNGNFRNALLIFLILGLSNIRFVAPGEQDYSGFHILPWFMALVILTMISLFCVWRKYTNHRLKILLFILLICIGAVVIKESKLSLFQTKNQALDFYINYSRQADFGQAIKIMKKEGESLFVVPDEWLIYWQADIRHASWMVNYYAWMAQVPEIKKPLEAMFSLHPPVYFYCDRCQHGYFGLEKFFGQYQKIKKDGSETNLMVLNKKLHQIDQKQKDQLRYYNFAID